MTRSVYIVMFVLSFFVSQLGFASSDVLQKSISDIKYEKLLKCIKNNNNDISLCINKMKDFFKEEIKFIKTSDMKDIDSQRLNKTIEYLKKSTDIFYSKAKSASNLSYYEKAAKCAELLIQLSEKFENYEYMIEEYKAVKFGKLSTTSMNVLLDKIDNIHYPSSEFCNTFGGLVKIVKSENNHIEKNAIDKVYKIGNKCTVSYIDHLNNILKSLKLIKKPIFGDILTEFLIYQISLQLPKVKDNNIQTIEDLHGKISETIEKHFNSLTAVQKEMFDYYFNDRFDEITNQISSMISLTECLIYSYKKAKTLKEIFKNLPNYNVHEIQRKVLNKNIFISINGASVALNNNKHITSFQFWNSAINQAYSSKLIARLNIDKEKTMEAATKFTVDVALDFISNNKYVEGLDYVDSILTLPLKKNQINRINSVRSNIVESGQKYLIAKMENTTIFNVLETVEKNENIWKDAKRIGLNTELKDAYFSVCKKFATVVFNVYLARRKLYLEQVKKEIYTNEE